MKPLPTHLTVNPQTLRFRRLMVSEPPTSLVVKCWSDFYSSAAGNVRVEALWDGERHPDGAVWLADVATRGQAEHDTAERHLYALVDRIDDVPTMWADLVTHARDALLEFCRTQIEQHAAIIQSLGDQIVADLTKES